MQLPVQQLGFTPLAMHTTRDPAPLRCLRGTLVLPAACRLPAAGWQGHEPEVEHS